MPDSKVVTSKAIVNNEMSYDELTPAIQSMPKGYQEKKPKEIEDSISKKPQIPDGARVATIIVKKGEIVEKIYMTNDNHRICLKEEKR